MKSIEDRKELTRVRNKSQERDKEIEKARKRDKEFWDKVKLGAKVGTGAVAALGVAVAAPEVAVLIGASVVDYMTGNHFGSGYWLIEAAKLDPW